jgi:hypothetical protein
MSAKYDCCGECDTTKGCGCPDLCGMECDRTGERTPTAEPVTFEGPLWTEDRKRWYLEGYAAAQRSTAEVERRDLEVFDAIALAAQKYGVKAEKWQYIKAAARAALKENP